MKTQIIDGTLSEVREKLSSIADEGQAARIIIYENGATRHPPAWEVDANGKPFPTREETLAYLHERLQNPMTDPEEIRKADEEYAELERNLNQNRIDAGERPLFPE